MEGMDAVVTCGFMHIVSSVTVASLVRKSCWSHKVEKSQAN